jgi:hypothetical protein
MSVCIEFGDEREGQPVLQVGTNKGWDDVCDWAEQQDPDEYPELLTLALLGESTDISAMIVELNTILAGDEMDDHRLRTTLEGLRDALVAHEDEDYVIVGDGFHSGYDEGPDEEE